jgi:hypothetical protein
VEVWPLTRTSYPANRLVLVYPRDKTAARPSYGTKSAQRRDLAGYPRRRLLWHGLRTRRGRFRGEFEFESLYPRNKGAVIEMPLTDFMAAAKRELEELKADYSGTEPSASETAQSKPRLIKAAKPIKAPTTAPSVQ